MTPAENLLLRERRSVMAKARWADPAQRALASAAAKRRFSDPAQRAAVAEARRAYAFKKNGCKSWEQRFWESVDRSGGLNACWEWKDRRDKDGYGHSFKQTSSQRAHRSAYMYVKGHIPDDLCILHSCDNPPCCNPAHLSVGTHADNGRDKRLRNRSASGTRNGNAKLTLAKVLHMRALWDYDSTRYTAIVLSRKFNIGVPHIYNVVNRKNWTANA